MKKVIYLAFGASILFSSCLFTEDEKFSDSSTVRVEQLSDECQNTLVAAPKGWVMELYPNTSMYGSFLIHMNFTQMSVTMTSSDMKQTASSLYKMRTSNGTELSFDTYNPVLHAFSDPGSDGVGYGGDFEFMVVSVTDQLITLKGSKTGNKVFLHRLADDQDFAGYLDAVQKNANHFMVNDEQPVWIATNGEKSTYLDLDKNGLMAVSADLTFPLDDTDYISASFRPSSLYLNPGVTLGNTTYSEFTLKDGKLVSSEDAAVFITGVDLATFLQSQHSVGYAVAANALPEPIKSAASLLESQIVSIYPKHKLQSIALMNDKKIGYCIAVKTKSTLSRYSINLTSDGAASTITIAMPEQVQMDNNGALYASKGVTAYQDLIQALCGTYNVTAENPFILDGVKLTKTEGGVELITSRGKVK